MRYTYVRQHDTTDCAAACLAMVCLHYKKEITITRLRDMMGTDLKGTNLTGLQKAAEELGFSTAAVRVDRENFLSEFSVPCIAQVITDEGLAHFVTVFKKTTIKDDGERRRQIVPVRAAVAGKTGIHEPQAVQKLRPCAEGAADARHAGPLVQRQRGGDVKHLIHLCLGGLGHAAAGVGGQRVKVAARALGIQHAECQRRFARPGHCLLYTSDAADEL